MNATKAQARKELERRTNGALELSISEAIEWLDSEDAAELIEAAELTRLSTQELLYELTGVSA